MIIKKILFYLVSCVKVPLNLPAACESSTPETVEVDKFGVCRFLAISSEFPNFGV